MGDNKERAATIRERIARLISVKTLMTLPLTAAFIYLAINGTITGDKFNDLFLIVVSFYFGTQAKKD